MARASATAAVVEQCWTLLGTRRGRIWHARRCRRLDGTAVAVRFDGSWVLDREGRRGDVVGFLHTHPGMAALPSRRDLRTMRAWRDAFGKPLLCLISGADGLRGWRFDDKHPSGVLLSEIALFPRVVVVAIE